MSDFDPDAYLKQKAVAGGGFDPDAYLAEKTNGKTLADRQADVRAAVVADRAAQVEQLGTGGRFLTGVGAGMVNVGRNVADIASHIPGLGGLRPDAQAWAEEKTLNGPLLDTTAGNVGNFVGEVAATAPIGAGVGGLTRALAARALPAGAAAVAPWLAAAAEGASQGSVLAGPDNRGGGALTGAALGAGARGLGVLGGRALGKVAAIDETVARKAAAEAAKETATLRSAAGRAAQDAYKQLEHLRELGRLGMLSPEGEAAAQKLAVELGQKAEAKLLPAIAEKEAAAQALSEAAANEGGRAEQIAASKLGLGELKQQVLPRLLRYGPRVVGGALLGHGVSHGPAGLLGGAATGALLGPMLHSMKRLALQPVVQRPVMLAAGHLAQLAEPAVLRGVTGEAARGMSPEVQALLEALLGRPALAGEPDGSQQLAGALAPP